MATKNAKKAVKPATPKASAKANPKPKKSSAKFASFSVRAVIPTQAYGNIQPEIFVTANTYEEARDFAMPLIGELFTKYSETRPTFLGKIEETVRVVPVAHPVPAAAPAPMAVPQMQNAPVGAANTAPELPAAPSADKPPPVLKAEKMIGLAATEDAAKLIQDQIEKSVKIPAEFKPDLITLVLKRRNELK